MQQMSRKQEETDMFDSKEAYLEKLKAKLDEWNAQIDKLKAKAAQSKADAKIEIEKRVGDLETRRQEVENKIQQLVQASGSAWKDLKGGVQRAWDKLDEAVKSATAKFK
jgi:uncharacterized coiled-coil DUF342 family protein